MTFLAYTLFTCTAALTTDSDGFDIDFAPVTMQVGDIILLYLPSCGDQFWTLVDYDRSIISRVGRVGEQRFQAVGSGETVIRAWRAKPNGYPGPELRIKVLVRERKK